MKAKNKLYKLYIKNGRFESDFVFIESLVNEINELISNAKNYVNLCIKQKPIGQIVKHFTTATKFRLF